MKSVICTFLACFATTAAFCDGPRFYVDEAAKHIVSWNAENESTGKFVMTGKLTDGGEVVISTHANALIIRSKHGKAEQELLVYVDEQMLDIEIGVYEYDFDKDGTMELMIVDSQDLYAASIHVYSYNEGAFGLVGNFSGMEFINLEANVIRMPYGSQGLAMEYVYLSGAFFELVYHDPGAEE